MHMCLDPMTPQPSSIALDEMCPSGDPWAKALCRM